MAEPLHYDAVILLGAWETELRTMWERLDEVAEASEDFGLLAVAHKVREAMGPLASAQRACPQYLDGTLEVDS